MPVVPAGTGEGAEKAISGLITRVGFDVSGNDPIRLVAVASTIMNRPSSERVGVKVADVAPEISVHVPRSAGSVQLFHW